MLLAVTSMKVNIGDLHDVRLRQTVDCSCCRKALSKSSCILGDDLDLREIAHPSADVLAGDVLCWAEEVCTILTKLRVAKCQKLVVAIANLNAVVQGTVNAGVKLIIPLLVGAGVDATLQ